MYAWRMCTTNFCEKECIIFKIESYKTVANKFYFSDINQDNLNYKIHTFIGFIVIKVPTIQILIENFKGKFIYPKKSIEGLVYKIMMIKKRSY